MPRDIRDILSLLRKGEGSGVSGARGPQGPPGADGTPQDVQSAGYWSCLTNGNPDTPELIWTDGGDVIMGWIPTP